MTYDPNGRFKVVNQPALSPGADFITSSTNGPFIDTGKTVEWLEGKNRPRVYLSYDTVREMADDLGMFDDLRKFAEDNFLAGYGQGHSDGVKENFDADLTDVAERLGNIADALRGGIVGGVPVALAQPAEADSSDAGHDEVDSAPAAPQPRQPRKAAGKSRPADVPDVAGSGATLSL